MGHGSFDGPWLARGLRSKSPYRAQLEERRPGPQLSPHIEARGPIALRIASYLAYCFVFVSALVATLAMAGPKGSASKRATAFNGNGPQATAQQTAVPQIVALEHTVVPLTYFGMHVHRLTTTTPWPTVQFGSLRLWDAGVSWPELEPAKGQWNFAVLDRTIALAEAHHVDILMTLGPTPAWASKRPLEISDYKPGNAAEPADMADWREYVRALATRYQGRIHYYEVWNEPNRVKAYSGTVATMVAMTSDAKQITRQIDPSIRIVSPCPTGAQGLPWLKNFLELRGGNFVDVIGYHFYVFPAAPETMVPLAGSVRSILRENGLSKLPLWNTESGWHQPNPFADSLAGAYVARSYLLNRSAGVDRFFWYAWDNHTWVTLAMTTPQNEPLEAATAYATVEKWMLGAVLGGCTSDASATLTCTLMRNQKTERVMWNADRETTIQIPTTLNATTYTDLDAKVHAVQGKMAVGPSPVLLQ